MGRNDFGRVVLAHNQDHLTAVEARAGNTPHVVRYILIMSLLLTLIAMAFALSLYAS